MKKNISKFIATPVVAVAAFAGISFFASSEDADALTVEATLDAMAVELALTSDDVAVADSPSADNVDAKPELVIPDELQEAVGNLQHAIDMANEVRIAMLSRIGRVEVTRRNNSIEDQRLLAVSWVVPESERDQALHDAIVEALATVEANLAEIIENSSGDYGNAEAKLNGLREHLVSVYEPYGPYENPFSYPPQWLAALPNGDPRWLPFGTVQHIGPEMIVTSNHLGTRFVGNNGEDPGDITQQYAVSIQPIIECFGPRPWLSHEFHTSGARAANDRYWRTTDWDGRSFPRDTPNGVCRAMLPEFSPLNETELRDADFNALRNTTFFHYNVEKNQFENLTALAEETGRIRDNYRDFAVRVNPDSTLIRGNLDFERDENGFVVFRPMTTDPERLELLLAFGNTWQSDLQFPQSGFRNRIWDWVYQGPDQTSGGWRVFAPYERSFPATVARLAENDVELAAILQRMEDPEHLAALHEAIRGANPDLTGNWDWGPGPDWRP